MWVWDVLCAGLGLVWVSILLGLGHDLVSVSMVLTTTLCLLSSYLSCKYHVFFLPIPVYRNTPHLYLSDMSIKKSVTQYTGRQKKSVKQQLQSMEHHQCHKHVHSLAEFLKDDDLLYSNMDTTGLDTNFVLMSRSTDWPTESRYISG